MRRSRTARGEDLTRLTAVVAGPRQYLLGLAEAGVAAGSRVHERTRVTNIEAGESCTVRAEYGALLHARDVVVSPSPRCSTSFG